MSKNNKNINQAAKDIVDLSNILDRANSISAKVVKDNKDDIEKKFPSLFENLKEMTKNNDTKGILKLMETIKEAEEKEKSK